MPLQSKLLSHTLAFYIESLLPVQQPKDFSIPDKVLKSIYDKVVSEESIEFKGNKRQIRSTIIAQIKSGGRIDGKKIALAAKNKGFEWHLFERCVFLCEQNGLDNASFRYTHPPAMLSFDKKDDLSTLTVSEIKSILKASGHKMTGNREELLDRLWQFLPIKDTEHVLKLKHDKNLSAYEDKQLALKYESLARFILHRTYFVMQIIRQLTNSN
ncbi:MAG: hypothetical protein Q4P13_09105, partial [Psychrobacter sp.]|nr:hypothetical protein [Psychrobacter sp.]